MIEPRMKFQGIIPPVTTPFSPEGRVRYRAFESNLEKYLRTPVSGVLLLGSSGEAPHLTPDEKLRLIERAIPLMEGKRDLLVGVSAQTLKDCLSFLERIATFRIRAVLVSVPHYYKDRMTGEVIYRYFSDVSERSPFPVLLYNVPQYTGVEIPCETVEDLSAHPNIVGMKDSSGDMGYLERLVKVTGTNQNFEILLGAAELLGPALTLGVRAAILAIACVVPAEATDLLERFLEGQHIGTQHHELARLSQALVATHGLPGIKYGMDLVGFSGGACRRPLLPLGLKEKLSIEGLLAGHLGSGIGTGKSST